jgi:alpha-ribazole phosphatase
MKLTLIRHTSLQVAPGICYGQSDIDVAASFANEAANTQTKIANINFDAVYTSPLQRCVKLAEALNLGDAVQDNRLKELHFGDWEMQAWNDMPRDIFDAWAQDYANLAPPNGETFSQLQHRGLAFLDNIMTTSPEANICVVSHGGMIRAMLAHALDMPLKGLFRFDIDYGSVTQIVFKKDAAPKINFVNL